VQAPMINMHCRTTFYTALGRLLMVELGEDEEQFERFMLPLRGISPAICLLLVKQVLMYYGSGTVDRIASGQPAETAAYATEGPRQTLCVHSPEGSTFCVK